MSAVGETTSFHLWSNTHRPPSLLSPSVHPTPEQACSCSVRSRCMNPHETAAPLEGPHPVGENQCWRRVRDPESPLNESKSLLRSRHSSCQPSSRRTLRTLSLPA